MTDTKETTTTAAPPAKIAAVPVTAVDVAAAFTKVRSWTRTALSWAWSTFLTTLLYVIVFVFFAIIAIDCIAGVVYVCDRLGVCVHRHHDPVAPKVNPAPVAPVAPHNGCAAGCHCGKVGCNCAATKPAGVCVED